MMEADTVSPTRNQLPPTASQRRPWQGSWADLPLTVVTWAVMLVAVWHREGHTEYPGTALVVFPALQGLPLLARTRWPLPVLVGTVAASAAQLVLIPQL